MGPGWRAQPGSSTPWHSRADRTAITVDPFVIRYLDGSTLSDPVRSASPARADLSLVGREAIQTGRLLAALSTALDLTEGQLPGHSLRTCFLAMRIAGALGLSEADRETLFFAAFLKDAGCSSNAASITQIFGVDEIALKGRQATIDRSIIAYAAFTIRNLPDAEPLPLRLRRLIRIGLDGRTARRAIEQIRCERGATIARKAGFGEPVAKAVHDVHEHWDGGGHPRGLRGDAIDPFARIIAACAGLDVFVSTQGKAEAVRVLAERRGHWYDPEIVGVLLDLTSRGLLEDVAAPDLVGRTMAFEPDSVIRLADDAAVDRIAERLRRHRRREEPVHRPPLAAKSPGWQVAWRRGWASRPRTSSTFGGPASCTTSASSASRT